MVPSEEKDPVTNCYFCMTNLKDINKHYAQYPDVPSAIKPIPRGPNLPVPGLNVAIESSSDSESSYSTDTAECGPYRPEESDQLVPCDCGDQ